MAKFKTNYLIVDSAGFLKHCDLQNLGKNIYTVPQVVEEIKDSATRQRLQVLPYELVLKDATPESVSLVREFSKKSGDYPSLSATDLKVLALTYDLEKSLNGIEHLRTEPQQKKVVQGSKDPLTENMPGFYFPKKDHINLNEDAETVELNEDVKTEPHDDSVISNGKSIAGDENDVPEENDNDLEDDDSWITLQNLDLSKNYLSKNIEEKEVIDVACLTSDFAMQNVLKQIGLHVLSPDGIIIRETRTYILRCFSCYKTTSKMDKVFCPNCGNKTLKRVSVTVSPDGQQIIHLSKRPLNIRGTKYSLPMPKGGKHANNPILCEDQRIPQQRVSNLARNKVDVLDPDYVARSSPFALNDVCSRSANLGIRGSRSNQYSNHKKTKRKN